MQIIRTETQNFWYRTNTTLQSSHQKGVHAVTEANEQQLQQRYQEFLNLMPLTLALAGLPPSEQGKYLTDEQIEARVYTIRHALKHAREFAKEAVQR